MSKQKLICKVIIIFLLIMGAGMAAGGLIGITYIDKISKEYLPITAHIDEIRKYTKHQHGKIRTLRDVSVSYTVDGKAYTEYLNTYQSSWKAGDNIELEYNPNYPSEIRSIGTERILFNVLMFAGVMLFATGLLLPRLLRKLDIKKATTDF